MATQPINPNDTIATGTPTGVATLNHGDTITSGVQYYKYADSPTYLNSQFSSTATPQSTAGAIPADTLGAGTAIKVPTLSTDTSAANGMVEGVKSALDYYNESQMPQTETSKQYNDILGSINGLLPELANKSSDQLKTEQTLGLPDLKKQLADINSLITTRLADYNKQITQTATASGETPLPIVLGRQAVIQRNQAADIGLLQARALGLQGQVQAAQDTANRAIDLKYGTLEDEINVKAQQLQLIQPLLNAEEKRWSDALQRKYEDDKQRLADEREQQKAIQSIALEAAQYGASGDVLDQIGKATNPMEAIALAGKFLAGPFNLQRAQLGVSQGNLALAQRKQALDEAQAAGSQQSSGLLQLSRAQDSISQVSSLLSNDALKSAVGPTALARSGVHLFGIPIIPTTTNTFTGKQQNFIAGVEQLRSALNLDALIKAKSQGATFGALSDQELRVLANTATKIGSWAIKDKSGNVVGYDASERDFKSELDRINNFAKLDYVLKGGDPSQVGVRVEKDGSLTTINWDGSVTQLLAP